jgi:predicted esterase YcpF (UPF0227 family)
MSSNKSQKTEWLNEKHLVFNPVLNYNDNSETIFKDLELILEQNNVDLIIGSSMGGHLGFHLSNKFNTPSLLFNPSLEENSIEKPKVDEVENLTIKHTIVLGKYDDIVIPSDTLKFLENKKANFIHTFGEHKHRTPLEIFKKHFSLHYSSVYPSSIQGRV